jgi:hypothetical protein
MLDVLGMNEQDVVDDVELPEESGADETVEVAASDEAVRPIEWEFNRDVIPPWSSSIRKP